MVKAGDKLPRSRLIGATVFLNYNFLKPRDNVLSDFQTWFCRESAWCTECPKQIFAKGRKLKRRRQLIYLQSSPSAPFPGLDNTDLLSFSGDFTKWTFHQKGTFQHMTFASFLSLTLMLFNFIHFCAWKIIFISDNIPLRVMHHDIYQLVNICVGSTFRRIWHP